MLLPHLVRRSATHPFGVFDDLHREFDRFFGNGNISSRREDLPAVNVWRTEKGLTFLAETPGVAPEDLDLSIHENVLKIRGSRRPVELGENDRIYRQERDHGEFERTFELPIRIDPDKVNAEYRNGVLMLDLPQAEEDRPRKIELKTARK